MFNRINRILPAIALSCALAAPAMAQTAAPGPDGLVKVRSAFSMEETIARIWRDIADKGILFFQAVDQAQLAAQ